MFIHYGLYAQLEKGEWVQLRDTIPVAEYAKLKDSFTADGFDAEKITDLALEAGMKYITITSKHHDGFCLFNTKETDFNSVSAPSNRDLIKEIYEACEKKGLGLFLYYSYAADWKHPYFYSRESGWENARPAYKNPQPEYQFKNDKDFKKYIQYAHAQIKELLIQYPNIAGIWLDPIMGFYSRPEIFPIEKTYDLIRSMSPHALISFKQGANGEEDFSAPERNFNAKVGNGIEVAQRVYEKNKNKPKEICNTLQRHYWGYSKADDGHHKSSNEIIELLNDLEKQPANLLLNVGPLPNGAFPEEDITILKEVGVKINLNRQEKLKKKYPNIVFILADDLGYGDIQSLNPDGKIPTPNINQIAKNGIIFTDAHSPSSVCTPTRYSILTGRYAWRTRLKKGVLVEYDSPLIENNRKTMPEILRQKNYQTAAFGKWHLGFEWKTLDGNSPIDQAKINNIDYSMELKGGPLDHGFDYFFGMDAPNYPPYTFMENRKLLGEITKFYENHPYADCRKGTGVENWDLEKILPTIKEKTIHFIKEKTDKNKPFFIYLPLTAPHTPIAPSPKFKGISKLNEYADFVMEVDNFVGEILSNLKETGQYENTLVVFTSDNGCSPMADFSFLKENGRDPSGIYRGHKADSYDGGHRIPLLIQWPEKIAKGKTINQTVSLADFYATFASLVDYPIQENEGEDSFDLSPLIFHPDTEKIVREATVHHSFLGEFSIRKNKWKLILGPGSGGWSFPIKKEDLIGLPLVQLYDMENDPQEKKNLESDHPEIVSELTNLLNSTKESGKSTPQAKRPNVIIILSDDQGWGDLSVTGNPFVQTPRIDQLANEGVLFNAFYVNPVCSPTRAELLTGKYHSRSGVYGTSAGGERVNLGQKMIGEYFQENGYKTAMFGKWHSGQQFPYHPNSRGFEEFIGYCSGHLGNYFDATIEHNGEPLQSKGYLTDYLTNQAIQYIDKQKENPFFVYLSLNTPHSPMQVPDPWWGKFKDMNAKTLGVEEKYLDHTRAAYAMMENIDWNMEKLYLYLKENDLIDNTIIVYFGDNGPNGPRWNDGLKGIKGSTYEGGIRSSLIIHYPKINDKIEHRTNQLTSSIDLMPTILDLAGIPFHDPIDGISVKESLLTNKINNNRYVFQHWGNRVSVRKEHFRLDQDNLLYDLRYDKGETEPLVNHPIHQEMIQKKNEWIEQVLKLSPEIDSRPYPIAGSDFINTHLPAGEAKFSEGIQRSNQYPNDSFLINWTNSSDSIYWNAEVLETGNYYADIYYNAEKDEIGTEIELIAGNQKGLISIEKEFNAQLKGMENDRFKRIESYVKEFIPQRSSIFQLEKGEQIIRLKRKTNSKGKGIEFKKIIFYKL